MCIWNVCHFIWCPQKSKRRKICSSNHLNSCFISMMMLSYEFLWLKAIYISKFSSVIIFIFFCKSQCCNDSSCLHSLLINESFSYHYIDIEVSLAFYVNKLLYDIEKNVLRKFIWGLCWSYALQQLKIYLHDTSKGIEQKCSLIFWYLHIWKLFVP